MDNMILITFNFAHTITTEEPFVCDCPRLKLNHIKLFHGTLEVTVKSGGSLVLTQRLHSACGRPPCHASGVQPHSDRDD